MAVAGFFVVRATTPSTPTAMPSHSGKLPANGPSAIPPARSPAATPGARLAKLSVDLPEGYGLALGAGPSRPVRLDTGAELSLSWSNGFCGLCCEHEVHHVGHLSQARHHVLLPGTRPRRWHPERNPVRRRRPARPNRERLPDSPRRRSARHGPRRLAPPSSQPCATCRCWCPPDARRRVGRSDSQTAAYAPKPA